MKRLLIRFIVNVCNEVIATDCVFGQVLMGACDSSYFVTDIDIEVNDDATVITYNGVVITGFIETYQKNY